MRSIYKIIRVPIFNFVKDLSFRRDFTAREWEERKAGGSRAQEEKDNSRYRKMQKA